MKEKTPLSHEVACFQILDFETSKSNSEVSKSNSNSLVGAVSHNVLNYQQLSISWLYHYYFE